MDTTAKLWDVEKGSEICTLSVSLHRTLNAYDDRALLGEDGLSSFP